MVMFDLQRIFHTGIIVHDLAAAQRELGATMNVGWTAVQRFDPLPFWTPERGLHEITVEAVYSKPGPHHLELVTGPQGSFYDPDMRPDGRHIGVWVENLPAEVERLLAAGWKVLAAGGAPDDGYGVLAYVTPPTTLFIAELVCLDLKPVIDGWFVED